MLKVDIYQIYHLYERKTLIHKTFSYKQTLVKSYVFISLFRFRGRVGSEQSALFRWSTTKSVTFLLFFFWDQVVESSSCSFEMCVGPGVMGTCRWSSTPPYKHAPGCSHCPLNPVNLWLKNLLKNLKNHILQYKKLSLWHVLFNCFTFLS